MKKRICTGLFALLLVSAAACSSGVTQTTNQQPSVPASGELRFKAPDGWITEKTTSTMRVAQYKLPKADGDAEDASLVLYYFGAAQGGSTQANVERWINQIKQPDGSSSRQPSIG